MEKHEFDNHIKAGEITSEAQDKARELLSEGAKIYEAAESIEDFIIKKGGKPAFPINLSFNENAAHQTPSYNDKTIVGKDDVIKVDIGVHVDGYICDSAFTLNHSGKYAEMVSTAEAALEKALAIAKEGTKLQDIGSAIEETIKAKGLKVIQNLSGHGLEQYVQHAPPSIPNLGSADTRKLEDGKAYALEPFASNGWGNVVHGTTTEIFEIKELKNTRHQGARKILEYAMENYNKLPFAERWLYRDLKISEFEIKVGLKQLLREKILESFPILHEKPGSIVAQAENTIVIYKGKTYSLLCEHVKKAD